MESKQNPINSEEGNKKLILKLHKREKEWFSRFKCIRERTLTIQD